MYPLKFIAVRNRFVRAIQNNLAERTKDVSKNCKIDNYILMRYNKFIKHKVRK